MLLFTGFVQKSRRRWATRGAQTEGSANSSKVKRPSSPVGRSPWRVSGENCPHFLLSSHDRKCASTERKDGRLQRLRLCQPRKWEKLLPWPLGGWVGVGVDGRRRGLGKGGRGGGVGRVCRGGISRHDVMLAVGGHVSGRGGGRGGRQVEVEGSGGGSRGRDPLQDHVRVELRLGAVEAGHGRLQETLLTPA